MPRPPAPNVHGGQYAPVFDVTEGAVGFRCECYVPLYEAKMVHQFDHRWATYDGGEVRDATVSEKLDPGFEPYARYWIPQHEIVDRLKTKNWRQKWLMGWRDICRSTDERTLNFWANSNFRVWGQISTHVLG